MVKNLINKIVLTSILTLVFSCSADDIKSGFFAVPNAAQSVRLIYFKPEAPWKGANLWFWHKDASTNGLGPWPGNATMDPIAKQDGWFSIAQTEIKPWGGFLFNDGLGVRQTINIQDSGNGCFVENRGWFRLNTPNCPFNPAGEISPIEVSANRSTSSFSGDFIRVVLHVAGDKLKNNVGYYTLDGSDPAASSSAYTFKAGDELILGRSLLVGESVKVNLFASDGAGAEARATYVYTKTNQDYEVRDNITMLQGFWWYIKCPLQDNWDYKKQLEPESNLWEYIAAEKAEEFYLDGFSHVWLPPTGKAFSPSDDCNPGYAIYDHYDLGEFYQMGRIRTKYGTKNQLIEAVTALQDRKIKVIADIVMNQMLGTDKVTSMPISYGYMTHNYKLEQQLPWGEYKKDPAYNVPYKKIYDGTVDAYLHFDFLNEQDVKDGGDVGPRGTIYSDFIWKPEHFDGIESYGNYYLFKGKKIDNVNIFDDLPAGSSQDYKALRSDIILGADVDLQHPEARQEMIRWSKWLVNEVKFDGFRVDAIRHMDTGFVKEWAAAMRSTMPSDALMFGENWDGWNTRLHAYLKHVGNQKNFNAANPQAYSGLGYAMSLLDVPLHYDFQKVAGENVTSKDISTLPDSGLLALDPKYTVTFVDNHDTVPTEQLASYIPLHTKYQAYTFILLNTNGVPCVFYQDIYKGNSLPASAQDPYTYTHGEEMNRNIRELVKLRNKYVYGRMEYFRGSRILGAKIEGRNANGGLVYLIKNNGGSSNSLNIPTDGRKWRLAAGEGDQHSFRLTGNWAVWVQE